MTVLDNPETGTVRLVVNNPELARETLSDAGVKHASARCLALEMPNNPGGVAGITCTLTLASTNIDAIHTSSVPGAGTALGIFRVSDIERALALDSENCVLSL